MAVPHWRKRTSSLGDAAPVEWEIIVKLASGEIASRSGIVEDFDVGSVKDEALVAYEIKKGGRECLRNALIHRFGLRAL